MQLWIIYSKKYDTAHQHITTLNMCKAAEKYNIEYELKFSHHFDIKENVLYYKNEAIPNLPKVALIRGYNNALMDYLEKHGTLLVNKFKGVNIARDKYLTFKFAKENNIKHPDTLSLDNQNFTEIKKILGIPFVLKDRNGSRGEKCFLISNNMDFLNIIEKYKDTSFILQKYIEGSKGKDARIYIVGEKIVDCILRESDNSDFRSNLNLGGNARKYAIPEEIKNQAIAIAKKLDLSIVSVDYLIDKGKYILCEINTNAGFIAFKKLGYNMQDIIMNFIKNKYFK